MCCENKRSGAFQSTHILMHREQKLLELINDYRNGSGAMKNADGRGSHATTSTHNNYNYNNDSDNDNINNGITHFIFIALAHVEC